MRFVIAALAAGCVLYAGQALAIEASGPREQPGVRAEKVVEEFSARRRHHRSHRHRHAHHAQVLAHPAGCPWRAFCGCGASVEVFGHPVPDLFLSSNWGRFRQAAPAPGMVAWRHGHVFVIREVYGDGTVLAYDANSGGHRTQLHRRSLAGYRVVNPHARA